MSIRETKNRIADLEDQVLLYEDTFVELTGLSRVDVQLAMASLDPANKLQQLLSLAGFGDSSKR